MDVVLLKDVEYNYTEFISAFNYTNNKYNQDRIKIIGGFDLNS